LCQGGSPAKFENVATRSIVPDEVKRCGKLIEVKKPRIISLVLDVLICISLLVVQVFPLPTDRDSVRYCGTECAYRSAEIETRSGALLPPPRRGLCFHRRQFVCMFVSRITQRLLNRFTNSGGKVACRPRK